MTTRGSDLKSVSRNAPWIKKSITDRQIIYKRNIFYTMDDTSFFFGDVKNALKLSITKLNTLLSADIQYKLNFN